ncbi:hypothetical protein [Methylophaga sp.]|uniref:hypothetical protein n=1 Tax=Methylophaga sp. TaxID=2024840 RepID=UPI0025EBD3C4|nr:hypothetical protein [Methylophaga sp.]
MSIINKLRESFSKSSGITEKLSQRYKEHIGEELARKDAQLRELEIALNKRKKELDAREAEFNRFYRIPRWIVILPISIMLLTVGLVFSFMQFTPQINQYLSSIHFFEPEERATNAQRENIPSYSECVSNGISYYKEIESYPKLRSGENAITVIKKKCNRSGLAFKQK